MIRLPIGNQLVHYRPLPRSRQPGFIARHIWVYIVDDAEIYAEFSGESFQLQCSLRLITPAKVNIQMEEGQVITIDPPES